VQARVGVFVTVAVGVERAEYGLTATAQPASAPGGVRCASAWRRVSHRRRRRPTALQPPPSPPTQREVFGVQARGCVFLAFAVGVERAKYGLTATTEPTSAPGGDWRASAWGRVRHRRRRRRTRRVRPYRNHRARQRTGRRSACKRVWVCSSPSASASASNAQSTALHPATSEFGGRRAPGTR
jgi:hypothetical protein